MRSAFWVITLSLAVAPIGASAQNFGPDKLPSNAVTLLKESAERQVCRPIPIGQYSWMYDKQTKRPVPVAMKQLEEVLLYEKHGIIAVSFEGDNGAGQGNFRTTLKRPADNAWIKQTTAGACLSPTDYSKAVGKVFKIDEVKGGRTGWTGTIAYIQFSGFSCYPTLIGEPLFCTPRFAAAERQYRVLFRQKPFGDGWLMQGFDLYNGEKFTTDNVPNALLQD